MLILDSLAFWPTSVTTEVEHTFSPWKYITGITPAVLEDDMLSQDQGAK